eukprot:3533286-Rhodomonas_salina.1
MHPRALQRLQSPDGRRAHGPRASSRAHRAPRLDPPKLLTPPRLLIPKYRICVVGRKRGRRSRRKEAA